MGQKASFLSSIKMAKSLWLFFGLTLASVSEAKVHIEPYAGWGVTIISSEPLTKENSNSAINTIGYLRKGEYYQGPTAGMRLGYSKLGLAVGVDFTTGHWDSIGNQNKKTIIPIMPALFVSYKLPLLFRAYASLIPQSITRINTSENSQNCTGTRGGKLGISYLSLPFLSVNLEYMPLYIGGNNCSSWSHSGTAYVNFTF